MKLNEKIACYRREKRMSQEELAAQVGVSRQAVSKWELGEASPDIGKLLALARAFGVTTDHLLDDAAEPETPPAPPPQEPEPSDPPPSQPAPGADLPGFLGKMVRRWGWLAGIYIALQGAGVALVGALARWGFGSMFSASHQMIGEAYGGWAYSGPPELESAILDELGIVQMTVPAPLSGVQSFFLGFATVILIVGIVIIGLGLGLALALWIKGRKWE